MLDPGGGGGAGKTTEYQSPDSTATASGRQKKPNFSQVI